MSRQSVRPDAGCAPLKALILACGNSLRGDDGVGWRIASILEQQRAREGVEIVFAQQWLPEYAQTLSAVDLAIFVDCSALVAAGVVSATPIEAATAFSGIFSHELNPASLLRLAQEYYGRTPSYAMAVTIGGQCYELTEELSAPVAAAVELAVNVVQYVLASWFAGQLLDTATVSVQ